MRSVAWSFSRRWWWIFGAFIAAPGVALALLGLRAIRADDIERQGLRRERHSAVASLSDVAIATALARFLAMAPTSRETNVLPFEIDRQGVVSFPVDRVFFGPFGLTPVSLANLEDDAARAAILQGRHRAAAQRVLAQLRSGHWWLSIDQRRAYDQLLCEWIVASGGPATSDGRLDAVEAAEGVIRQSLTGPPLSAGVRFVAQADARLLVVWSAAREAGAAAGAVVSGHRISEMFETALTPLLPSGVASEVRDPEGRTVWGRIPEEGDSVAHPLSALAGWKLQVADNTPPQSLRGRRFVSYALVLLPIVMLGSGLVMTAWIVRREMALAALQSKFVAAVTHEFKSPLTSIRLLMERIAGGHVSSPERYYTAVTAEADRLEGLVNRLLDSQKLRAGRKEYTFEPGSLALLTQSVLERLRPQAEAKQMTFDWRSDNDVPDLLIDRDALVDAIGNLIENAIKYSPAHSRVVVSLHASEHEVRLDVADEGVGVDPAEAERIFEPFYRSRRGDRASVHGTGLGLALVKAAAEAHGGSVAVASGGTSGSCFTLRLPLPRPS
jgi:two-component system phosphate regulon sensor histidine kinase PhoR